MREQECVNAMLFICNRFVAFVFIVVMVIDVVVESALQFKFLSNNNVDVAHIVPSPWHCCMYAKNLQFYYIINDTEFCYCCHEFQRVCACAPEVYDCYWNAWCMVIVAFGV